MSKRTIRRLGALAMAASMAALTACGGGGNAATTAAGSSGAGTSAAGAGSSAAAGDEVVRISLYPADANLTSGVVGGHKAKYFAENGFELEVWAYSDEKTNAILASGDLPDIMYVSKDNLDTMIEAGMLLNLDDYVDQIPHLKDNEKMQTALNFVRKYRSAGTGSVYALPLSVGESSTAISWTGQMERNSLKLNWDIYEEIGAPEIESFEDVIDVMEEMLKAHPEDEQGNPYYGTILNTGSDATYFQCMSLWYAFQGYDANQLPYLLETDMIAGTNNSILTKDSQYYKGLKWYNEVYRRGLMDPDSINNDRATQKVKVDGGFAMVPSGYLPGWAPQYLEYYIPGTNLYYSAESTYGTPNTVIAINANTEHLDACLKLLDLWCDPDAIFRIINGPDGEFWYSDGTDAYFTDSYLQKLKENNGSLHTTTFSDGEDASLWNTAFCVNTGENTSWGDGKGGTRSQRFAQWTENMEITTDNETFDNWKKTTGYNDWKSWLKAENAYHDDSEMKDITSFCSQPTDSMQLTLDALKDAVVNASWKMVYAEDDATFDALWDQMVADCEGLGVADVQQWRLDDIENAKSIKKSLAAE